MVARAGCGGLCPAIGQVLSDGDGPDRKPRSNFLPLAGDTLDELADHGLATSLSKETARDQP